MTEAPPETGTPPPPPPPRGSVLDAVRPTEGRLIGGVCEGLGRQIGVDPLILRVVLAVLTLVGFAGVVVYAAAWLVLPDQASGRSVAQEHLRVPDARARTVRHVVLVAGGVVGLLSVLGLATNGPWGISLPFALLVAVGLLVWWVFAPRNRNVDGAPAPNPPVAAPVPPAVPSPAPPPGQPFAMPSGPAQAPPAPAMPPVPPPAPPVLAAPRPPRPPNPRHDGGRLTLTFLLLSLASAGAIGVWSVAVDPLPWGAYAAAVLATLGVGMLVGSVVGNARTMTFPALLATLALAAMTVVPTPTLGDRLEQPVSASAVDDAYSLGMGRLVIDLSDVRDPAALAGRTVEVENGLGDVQVVLPEGVPVEVGTYTRAGELRVLDRTNRGNLVRLSTPEPDEPHLRIVTTQWAGRTIVDEDLLGGTTVPPTGPTTPTTPIAPTTTPTTPAGSIP